MIAQALLEFNTVAIGNSHIVHVHTEHQTTYVVSIGNTGTSTCPDCNAALRFLCLPIATYDLARYAHTGTDVSELNITMSTLIGVHEVHVHGVPGNFCIILRVEVEQGLLELLQAVNPHLGRREGVHPGHDADALLVVVGLLHHVLDLLGTVDRSLVDNLDGYDALVVQAVNHLLRVSVDNLHGLASIEQLCASHPPNLKLFKCFHHNSSIALVVIIFSSVRSRRWVHACARSVSRPAGDSLSLRG